MFVDAFGEMLALTGFQRSHFDLESIEYATVAPQGHMILLGRHVYLGLAGGEPTATPGR